MRGARIGFAFGILGVVGAMAVVFYLMLFGPDRLDFSPEGWPRTFESGEWLAVLVIPFTVIIMLVAMLPFRKVLFPVRIKNGEAAPARVLKVWDTGVSVNDSPQVGMLLEVSPSTISPYQVETAQVVSRLQAPLVQPGVAAEVRYDPKDPKRIELVGLDLRAAALPPRGTASERMQELKDLRDRDLVSEEEYEAKRAEILRGV